MVNKDFMRHLAELSKIEFTDDELEKISDDMGSIIALMDKVREFDSDKQPYKLDAVTYEDLRADECKKSYPTEKITGNAKNVKNNSFVVPKVV